jgi:hypothetical protein
MQTTDTPVVLGRLHHAAATAPWPKHVLLHLPAADMVVMPISQLTTAWRCTVIATRTACPAGHMILSNADLADTSPTITVDPEHDPDGYARLLWLPRAFALWPGGPMLALARHLADHLRTAGTITIPEAQLAAHAEIARWLPNSRPSAVERLLAGLTETGFLEPTNASVWELSLPPAPRR